MPSTLLRITDETATGDVTNEITIPFEVSETTVKDIISARVISEVDAYNNRATDYFRGLIQPSDAEQTLNGFKMKKVKKVDAEKQVYVALNAFQRNGFFVFINDRQAESLDEVVQLTDSTRVSFLKLTPLVGG